MADMELVSFIDADAQIVQLVDLPIPTGSSGRDQRLTVACHDYAIDHGYTHWVQQYVRRSAQTLKPTTSWLVFKVDQRRKVRNFLTTQPTREAAEMTVLHNAC